MKFICDVHISFKLVTYLKASGFECIHVNEILDKPETKDSDICAYADSNDFIVITKDSDFRDSHFILQTPKKLFKINLGNISNNQLISIFTKHMQSFQKLKAKQRFIVEIDHSAITIIEL